MFTKTVTITFWLLALLLCACAQAKPISEGEETPTPEEVSQNRTIVVALAQAPISLDPADHRDRTSETVIRSMFDGLVTRDTRSGVHLELAEEMNWLDDRTLEIKLCQGVLFHDGVEMTADDVVFSFNRIIQEKAIEYPEPHDSPRRSLIAPLESIEKVDNYTVLMHLSNPWPSALQMLVHQQIVPQHYVEEVGTQGFIEHPVGTGPFEFVSASPGLEEIVVQRFEHYRDGSEGAPIPLPAGGASVERVTFRVIPDASVRTAALLIGEVDIIQAVPLDLAETMEENPNIQVKTAPGTQPKWMEMNVNRPPFDDVRVRQALNYAVDKGRIVDEVYGGRAVALPGPLSPFNNLVNKGLEPYPYDREKALDLLAQAGWTDSDDDGILDQDGQPFTFALDTLPEWLPLATALVDQFRRVGVDVSVRVWESNVVKPHLLAGERLAYLDDWGLGPHPELGANFRQSYPSVWRLCNTITDDASASLPGNEQARGPAEHHREACAGPTPHGTHRMRNIGYDKCIK